MLESCECSKAYNLTELYFCNGCQNLNCRYCIHEEIDCYFCPNCLDHVSVAEASLYGNRCKKCYDCPICFGTLNYQQQQQQQQGTTTTTTTGTEVFFLNCAFCKWNSLDSEAKVDIQIGRVTREVTPQQTEVTRVLDALQKEMAEMSTPSKDNGARSVNRLKMAMKQFFNPQLSASSSSSSSSQQSGSGSSGSGSAANSASHDERWSMNKSVAQPQPSNPLMPPGNQLLGKVAIKKRVNPITSTDTDNMIQQRIDARSFKTTEQQQQQQEDSVNNDDEISESLLNMSDSSIASGINQRLASINTQSPLLSKLTPQHRQLMTRRSKRCKRCDKLLVKPDINPSKTEFKRQHFAFTYVPRITITKAVWLAKDLFDLYITFTNPLHSFLFMSFPQEFDSSVISVDDNSRVANVIKETYIVGLLDETDDQVNEALKHLKEQEKFIVERKDNKLTLKVMVKVTGGSAITEDSTSTAVVQQNSNERFESSFDNLKFTLFFEFSTNSSLILNLGGGDNATPTPVATPTTPSSVSVVPKSTPMKILFNIPASLFENTSILK
ncbi:dynactin 62 kDa subunit [Heterostelium album PN500]|uniref:Dynactin subunit 4 n=1 Tax=Heterostelium pallidum (strain ATCC 26659 / Pp 5 / PN500) TaxID=670386 RepID=D3B5L5_HETP5|nr:dynactin 62 kDa subunit [Heterostelium album PN500]EFA83163.1 dynactin 62 kDa subunit [Heterostelium album PN500]|eukprot:XP_020435280.1 dynactin 62 kDa subunit [Heterostelium album PN500]